MTSQPAITVAVPTFNRPALLRETITSVLSQTFEDFELVISDNASSEATHEVVAAFCDRRIRYHRNPTNIGLVGNLNRCLALGRGTFIAVFHDDDRMCPENLARKVDALRRYPSVGFVHSRFDSIDGDGAVIARDRTVGPMRTEDAFERGSDFLARTLTGWNVVNASSVVMRRECFQRLGGFSTRLLFTTDFEYWMRIACDYDVLFLAASLIECRIHEEAGTSDYVTFCDGCSFPNEEGLRQIFEAKQSVADRAACRFPHPREVKRSLIEWMARAAVDAAQQLQDRGASRRSAAELFFRLCRDYPQMLTSAPARLHALRLLLGQRGTRILRPLWRSGRRLA